MPEFEKYFDSATTPGYLRKIAKEIAVRLMAKGFGVNLIAAGEQTSILSVSSREGRNVFSVECIDNINITWRKLL